MYFLHSHYIVKGQKRYTVSVLQQTLQFPICVYKKVTLRLDLQYISDNYSKLTFISFLSFPLGVIME